MLYMSFNENEKATVEVLVAFMSGFQADQYFSVLCYAMRMHTTLYFFQPRRFELLAQPFVVQWAAVLQMIVTNFYIPL